MPLPTKLFPGLNILLNKQVINIAILGFVDNILSHKSHGILPKKLALDVDRQQRIVAQGWARMWKKGWWREQWGQALRRNQTEGPTQPRASTVKGKSCMFLLRGNFLVSVSSAVGGTVLPGS